MGESAYLNLLSEVLAIAKASPARSDRTGVGRHSVFGRQLRFDLTEGFPLLTTKRVHFKSVVAELIWFLSGSTNVRDLQEMGCTIWDEWAQPDGEVGPSYGSQWRSWGSFWRPSAGVDQIAALIARLRSDPVSSRHVVSAWNVADLPIMALPPCHFAFQCFVEHGRLSLMVTMRSADLFLGVPFNIASYALLTHMLAQQANMEVGEVILSIGDAHLYANHLGQAREQVSRAPRPFPELRLLTASIDSFHPDDCAVCDYHPHPAIPAPIAV